MSKTITLTDEQYAALKAGESITIELPKIKQWEPKGGDWFVGSWGEAMHAETSEEYRLFGVECETKEQAEAEAKAMRARNRIAAYVREFAPNWVADFGAAKNWFVYFDYFEVHEWCVTYNDANQSACEVYMPEHVARELAKKLNGGEVVL